MANGLPLASPGDVIDAWSTWNDSEGVAYVLRTAHMEVMRLHLNAGARIPTHEAQGEITILCVQGRAGVTAIGRRHELNTGQLLYLLVQEPFELCGIEESSLLITVLRQPASQPDLIGKSPD